MIIRILAYFVIPVYTILFTQGYNWFTTNFSVIGNLFDKKLAFFIWGMMVEVYFYMIYRRMKSLVNIPLLCAKLMPSALALLFCAITTPYLPEELPLKSFLHIVFAFVSTVLLVLFLFGTVWGQYRIYPGEFGGYLAALGAVVVISAVLLAVAGIVSSALEIFITLTTVILSERLIGKMHRLKHGFSGGKTGD